MEINKDSYFLFSGGEVHCKVEVPDANNTIWMRDYTMNGFMALAETVQIIKRLGHSEISVIYPYFPYARQDREMVKIEPFSLKIFCDLLNSLELEKVVVYDPHSDVVPALVNNCSVIEQAQIARMVLPKWFFLEKDVIFVSPDAGAYKKISKLVMDDSRIAIGTKNRDSTGKITHTGMYSPQSLVGKHCVIVDDICDGGRTFIELAKALKSHGAEKISLYVTHGIFSQGRDVLRPHIDKVYTTNSFPNIENEFIKVYKL